jgi:hypothetical protein
MRRLQIKPGRSLDQNDRERFHPLNITRHYLGDFSFPYEWVAQRALNPVKKVGFYRLQVCFQ